MLKSQNNETSGRTGLERTKSSNFRFLTFKNILVPQVLCELGAVGLKILGILRSRKSYIRDIGNKLQSKNIFEGLKT